MKRTLLVTLLAASMSLSGCLGLFGGDDDVDAAGNQGLDRLDNGTLRNLEGRIDTVPRNYTLSNQRDLPPAAVYFNGTIGAEANTAVEDRNDRGGNDFNTVVQTFDVSKYIPVGQPTEMKVVFYTEPQPGSSADLDLYIDVPGLKTTFSGDNGDEFNWKWQVQRMTVNTVGVAGHNHEVGIQVANGKIVDPMDYTLRVEFVYASDVLTPYHPYIFEVPRDASAIILESAKAGGSDHVKSRFVVIGPNNELVQYQDYNDISIPTESVFIPASAGPGEYIFYAFDMEGGFLRLYADAPVPNREVRVLPLVETKEMVATGPTPGAFERDWARGSVAEGGSAQTSGNAEETTLSVSTFPLRVIPVVEGEGATLGTQVTIKSSKGLVSQYTRVGRVDTAQGHLGYTSEYWNTVFNPENLERELTVGYTNNSPTLQAGYVLVTYDRPR